MKQIDVNILQGTVSYPVVIGVDYLSDLKSTVDLSTYTKVFCITDETVFDLYAKELAERFKTEPPIILKPGEISKNIKSVEYVWDQLNFLGADRKSLVINIGGGVVCDLGGFAASTYMRGIDFVNIPTTVLAAADASIGGKTGFDFAGLKNLIGTFAQPTAVIVDTNTFGTLDEKLYNEGLAEIIKHAAVFDENFFEQLESLLPKPTPEKMAEVIEKSCQLKAKIVSEDQKESGKRMLLNFGHTIGHAVESLSWVVEGAEPLLHGEAVAIGMVVEARQGEESGITKPGTAERIENLLVKVNLPTELPDWVEQKDLNSLIIKDKKNSSSQVNWVMLEQIGSAKAGVNIEDYST